MRPKHWVFATCAAVVIALVSGCAGFAWGFQQSVCRSNALLGMEQVSDSFRTMALLAEGESDDIARTQETWLYNAVYSMAIAQDTFFLTTANRAAMEMRFREAAGWHYRVGAYGELREKMERLVASCAEQVSKAEAKSEEDIDLELKARKALSSLADRAKRQTDAIEAVLLKYKPEK